MNYPFYWVDVFAIERYTGNQLAIFPDASQMRDRAMQELAKEINFSETTFITSSAYADNSYDVRIFTPNQELPFAGHPTLGTAYIIREYVMSFPEKERLNQVILNLKTGKVPVTWETTPQGEEVLWMQQNCPNFGQMIPRNHITSVLNLAEEEIDPHFPIQEVSTGIYFLIVPVKNLDILKKIQINLDAYYKLIASLKAKSIFVFCPETYSPQNDFCARMFSDHLGIPEDPATGSANGCFAAYLFQYNVLSTPEKKVQARVEQGYEINRPSLLLLKGSSEKIEVGGQVKTIAQGHFL